MFEKMRPPNAAVETPDEFSKFDSLRIAEDAKVKAQVEELESAIESGGEAALQPSGGDGFLHKALMAGIVATNINISDAQAGPRGFEIPLSPEQSTTVEKVLGMSAEKVRDMYIVQVPVKAGQGNRYIVHIGQKHQVSQATALERKSLQDSINATQRKAEQVLNHVSQSQNLECVFQEGYASYETAETNKSFIIDNTKKIEEALAKKMLTPEDVQYAAKLHSAVAKIALPHQVLRHYLSPILDKLEDALRSSSQDISTTGGPAAQSSGMQLASTVTSMTRVLNDTQQDKADPYTAGAAFKGFMEGSIRNICPTENIDLNVRALAAHKSWKDLDSALSLKRSEVQSRILNAPLVHAAFEKLPSFENRALTKAEHIEKEHLTSIVESAVASVAQDPELLALEKQTVSAREAAHHLMMIEREREVMRQLDAFDTKEIARGKPLGHMVIVYGKAHDFRTAVTEWNAKNPQRLQRGLISLTPRK